MKKIGEGRTANVFSDGNHAYKCFRKDYNLEYMQYEVDIQNEIYHQTNLDVCHYELADDKIQMTLLDGVLFADRIRVEKYKLWLEDFTDLQCETYQYRDLNLADAFVTFSKQINSSNLNQSLIDNALESLGKINKIYHLCHLDFHPLNIIYHQNKYTIIDWINAKMGNPVMDIASTYIIFRQYLKRQANKYLRMMAKKTKISMQSIIDAIPLMAFIRLRENDQKELEGLLLDLINGEDNIYNQ